MTSLTEGTGTLIVLMNSPLVGIEPWIGTIPVGVLLTPLCGLGWESLRKHDLDFAVDNGAFAGFRERPFASLLRRVEGLPRCRFVACPDVVGDARGTMRLFAAWAPRIRSLGLPVGLVAQDGMHEIDIPWPEIDAIFIGGTDAFKLGHHAGGLVREAADRGKWAHMGRVNGVGRLKYAMSLGADSVDGSGLARFSREKMPRLAKLFRGIEERPMFWSDPCK
jgi:hypothetical protein